MQVSEIANNNYYLLVHFVNLKLVFVLFDLEKVHKFLYNIWRK